MKNLIFILSIIYFMSSCSNKIEIMNWGKDKFSTITVDKNFLMTVTDSDEAKVASLGNNIQGILNIKVRDRDALRHATTIYIVPKKSHNTKYKFEEINSIKLIINSGKELFPDSISLSDRYDPQTETFKFYILADKKEGVSTITVLINGREVLQNQKIYFFNHLPYRADINFSWAQTSGGNSSNRRFCPGTCSDTLRIDISEMFDETTPGNQYFEDAKAKIKYSCTYYKQNAVKTSFSKINTTDCGEFKKTLNTSGETYFSLNNFNNVTQIYFNKNFIGTTSGSVFGLPNYSFLSGEEDIDVALKQDVDHIFNINSPVPNPLMFAYNREKFHEETYSKSSGNYNGDALLSPIWKTSGEGAKALKAKDTFISSGVPLATETVAAHSPLVMNLSNSHSFYYVPVSRESLTDIRALGALMRGNMSFNFIDSPLLTNPTFGTTSAEYKYGFSVLTGNEAGRTKFDIIIDGRKSSYNKRMIVFPNPPTKIGIVELISNVTDPNARDIYSTDTSLMNSTSTNIATINEEDLEFVFSEDNVAKTRGGKFNFTIKPKDNHNNLWETWDNSADDGSGPHRLYHNYLEVKSYSGANPRTRDFYRDRCDRGYAGSGDFDPSDNNLNNPRCAVHLSRSDTSGDNNGKFIVECYDFTHPGEYNLYPQGSNEPYTNVNYYYGYDNSSRRNPAAITVIIEPDDILISRIAHDYNDPVINGGGYLWGDKKLRICPRNEEGDYYVRDNTLSNYDFEGAITGIAQKNQDNGRNANLLSMKTENDLTTRHDFPQNDLTLKYKNSSTVIDGSHTDRGICNGATKTCTKILPAGADDITFFPIPGHDNTFNVSNDSETINITNYTLVSNVSKDPITDSNGPTIKHYEVSIKEVILSNPITITRDLKMCAHKNNQTLTGACGGDYTIPLYENLNGGFSTQESTPLCYKEANSGDKDFGPCNSSRTEKACASGNDVGDCIVFTTPACTEAHNNSSLTHEDGCYFNQACQSTPYTYPSTKTYSIGHSDGISAFNEFGKSSFSVKKGASGENTNGDNKIILTSFPAYPYTSSQLCSGSLLPATNRIDDYYKNMSLTFSIRGKYNGRNYSWLDVGTSSGIDISK